MSKVKAGKRESLIAGQAEAVLPQSHPISFCFAHFNRAQGDSLDRWETDKLLSKMIERFHGFGRQKLHQCLNNKFKKYSGFPKPSDFKHPPDVPPDAQWASMHLGNLPCVIGHVVHDVFYVVFLDGNHRFWIMGESK